MLFASNLALVANGLWLPQVKQKFVSRGIAQQGEICACTED